MRLNGIPVSIISDKDVKFVSYFKKTLWVKLGMEHLFSNAFHLHIDGQTEVTNRNLGNLLKCLTDDHVVN